MTVQAYAALEKGGKLEPFEYELDSIGPEEVDIEVMYCGICHSDLSMLNNEWGVTQYPFVPGHEIVGRVKTIGKQVNHLKKGQIVGVGWTAETCLSCNQCVSGNHNLCASARPTIAGRHGGFADYVRAQAIWAFPLPENFNYKAAGPLFCGGITVFNPIIQNNISPLHRVGVIGIGGLGHMALKFLNAWGCEVTAFSTSPEKEEEARQLGAHHFVSTHDKDALKKLRNSFDMVLNTVNVDLNWNAYIATLKPKGVFHMVGVANEIKAKIGLLMGQQRSISASPTGSPAIIRDMIDFAARHNISPQVEFFKMEEVNKAMEYLQNGKPRFRIVLEK